MRHGEALDGEVTGWDCVSNEGAMAKGTKETENVLDDVLWEARGGVPARRAGQKIGSVHLTFNQSHF